jgi:hypothetical protein
MHYRCLTVHGNLVVQLNFWKLVPLFRCSTAQVTIGRCEERSQMWLKGWGQWGEQKYDLGAVTGLAASLWLVLMQCIVLLLG